MEEKQQETPREAGMQKSELAQLLESARQQENFARRSLWHQRIRTLLVLVMVVAVVSVIGPAKAALNDVQLLTGNASYAVRELLDTVDALELDKTLDGIDKLVADSNQMVEDSAQDIQKSLQSIASLDVEGLNESIKALEAVTTSIGRLFGYKSN